jgi:hypothetical protein
MKPAPDRQQQKEKEKKFYVIHFRNHVVSEGISTAHQHRRSFCVFFLKLFYPLLRFLLERRKKPDRYFVECVET